MNLDSLHRRVLAPDIQRLIRNRARSLCKTNGFRRQDLDDLVQELTLRLLQRLPAYDPERASLYCFALVVLDRVSKHLIQSRAAGCRDRSSTVSLDTTFVDSDLLPVPLSEQIDADDRGNRTGRFASSETELRDLSLDVRIVLDAAPDRLKRLAEELLTSNRREIARRHRVRPEKLRHWIGQLRAEFEKSGWN
jgi:RNA polymerase sigma-70 factor, ECF subfamily